jgi:hypothetical protein
VSALGVLVETELMKKKTAKYLTERVSNDTGNGGTVNTRGY